MQPSPPEELDWVQVRADCTLTAVFEKLAAQVREDIDRVNALRSIKFEVTRNGAYLVIFQKDTGNRRSVTILCADSSIIVKDSADKIISEATLAINDEGKCWPVSIEECKFAADSSGRG